ncbi:hypothetical protein [Paracidovorax citrulli]|uniref:hypothetical protein n=1 Tax=Paracidovorax citrulli TaxID=80869 RepID=UPI0018E0B46D|nr:hypothetical protein [Paracidovorax citrulli]
MQTISSQHFLDDDIVAAKLAAQDFEVSVSPNSSSTARSFVWSWMATTALQLRSWLALSRSG